MGGVIGRAFEIINAIRDWFAKNIAYITAISLIVVDIRSADWEISWPIVVVMVLFFLPGILNSMKSLKLSFSDGMLEFTRALENKFDTSELDNRVVEELPSQSISSKYKEDIESIKILDSLNSSRYNYNRIEDIKKETGLDGVKIVVDLVFLKQDGLVLYREAESDYRWMITELGKSVLKSNLNNPQKEGD